MSKVTGKKSGELAAKLPKVPTHAPAEPAPPKERFKFDAIAIVKSQAFLPGVLLFVGLCLMFWEVVKFLPSLWLSDDGYYSHGFLVPLISGFIVFKAWPRIKDRPVQTQWWAAVFLVPLLYLALVSNMVGIYSIASYTMVACMLVSVLMLAGWQWLRALFFPICYLLFALPIWSMVIDVYTNPLQIVSTKVAYKLLEWFGLQPFEANSTTIFLNSGFALDVGVPCSGLKLILALSAFTVFFILVARLKAWANAFLAILVLPLAIAINGLRIALIGVVGDHYGAEAGIKFHDYSGYITLLICFFILFKVARGLGWKD